MSFFEQRFPERLSFGAQGGPKFSNEVTFTVGGQRFVNANWLMPLHVYDVTQGVKNETDFATIRAFFYNVGGQRDGFRFKDWADFQAGSGYVHPDPQPLSLISGSVYQINVTYTIGSRTFTRPIYKPVAGTVSVFRTRSGSTSSISPTIDTTTGRVTVSGHMSGDTYTWTGEFDVPVSFMLDQLEAEIVNKNGGGFLIQWPSIQLQEIRL